MLSTDIKVMFPGLLVPGRRSRFFSTCFFFHLFLIISNYGFFSTFFPSFSTNNYGFLKTNKNATMEFSIFSECVKGKPLSIVEDY